MGQHQDVLPPIVAHRAVASGPISLAPTSNAMFEEAALRAGAQRVEVGPETRGLVWLSEKHAEDLMAILQRFPAIDWVQLPWAGVDAFSSVLAHLAEKPEDLRPIVTSAKGSYSEPVAEHALALLLGCLRELPSKARDAHWKPHRTGLSLFERHIVLVGAGGIAQTFMEMVVPYRAMVTVVRRQNSPVVGAYRTITPDQLPEVLPTADAVVLAAAATESTRHLIGARELALLPKNAVVVNIARGSLLDLNALVSAVDSGQIYGAGLDVMDPEPFPDDHPVWAQRRIVITSHSADTPEMAQPLLAQRVENNIRAFLTGDTLRGVVDVTVGY